jgi:hypothetical protein
MVRKLPDEVQAKIDSGEKVKFEVRKNETIDYLNADGSVIVNIPLNAVCEKGSDMYNDLMKSAKS